MSTTSFCQPHHHEVVEQTGTREFMLENILERETLRFFSGKVAVRGRRWRVSVSPRSGKANKNVHETAARARFHIKIVKKNLLRPLLEDEVDKTCTRP